MQWNENVNKRDGTHKPLDEYIKEVAEGVETVLTPETEVKDGEEFVKSFIPSDPHWSVLSSLSASSGTVNESDTFGSFGTAKMLKIIIENNDDTESSICCHEIILSSNVLDHIKLLVDDADFNLPEIVISNIGTFDLMFIYSETEGYTFHAVGSLLTSVSEINIILYKGE